MNYSEYFQDSAVNHSTFYAQFVTDDVKRVVKIEIGKEQILQSNDIYFNDIPIKQWDILAERLLPQYAERLRQKECPVALSTIVCLLKEAARQIKESAN